MAPQGNKKTLKPLKLQGFSLVRGTGLEFKKNYFLQLIPSNFVINSSETVKHGTSQSSCFIRANAIKGTNKGQRIVKMKKSLKAQCFQGSIMVREAGLEPARP